MSINEKINIKNIDKKKIEFQNLIKTYEKSFYSDFCKILFKVVKIEILKEDLELFTDNYQNNHSMNVFAGNEQNKIYFQAVEGSVVLENVEVYGIEP